MEANMYFKKMTGTKCYLSPIDVDDAEKFTEWLNDLEFTVYLPFYSKIINTDSEREILNNISKGHNYSIIDIEKNELIGNCGFTKLDHLNQTGKVGIFIGNKNYWNKGYGSEAMTLLLDYGFKALNLHNISLEVLSFNERAIKSYKKVGFTNMGKSREVIRRGNETYDLIYMDILCDEFYEDNKIIKDIKKK
jgi:RimJ/RimL family protein N-acetyltransferase